MASSRDSHTRGSGGKPSHHHRHFLYYQAMLGFGLLPQGQNHPHFIKNTRSNLYTGDQLDSNAFMLGCYNRVPRHKAHGQCFRSNISHRINYAVLYLDQVRRSLRVFGSQRFVFEFFIYKSNNKFIILFGWLVIESCVESKYRKVDKLNKHTFFYLLNMLTLTLSSGFLHTVISI